MGQHREHDDYTKEVTRKFLNRNLPTTTVTRLKIKTGTDLCVLMGRQWFLLRVSMYANGV